MSRSTDYTKPPVDPVAYNRELYRKSERHRLARINHTRRRRGRPEIASLADAQFRVPMGAQ